MENGLPWVRLLGQYDVTLNLLLLFLILLFKFFKKYYFVLI